MYRLLWCMIVGSVLLLSSVETSHAQASFVARDCAFELRASIIVDCGDLVVPEDYANPDGATVRLSVAILRHPDGNPEPDPIIYLEGGPGGSAIETVQLVYNQRYRPLFDANRDIIIYDQRGIGTSAPAFDCTAYDALTLELLDYEIDGTTYTSADVSDLLLNELLACGATLARQHDVAQYNSRVGAQDIAALRTALGYEQVNLWGISYGTRLALSTMRDYPDALRSVVLDSVLPPDVAFFEQVPANWERALDQLFTACADDAACAATYPMLEDVFYATVAILNQSPARISITNPITGELYEDVIFDGDTFLSLTVQLLYDSNMLPLMPQLIYQVHTGRYGLYSAFVGSIFAQQTFISYGAYFTVHCAEEIPFSTPTRLRDAYAPYPDFQRIARQNSFAQQLFDVCEAFTITAEPAPRANQPVTSDIPTLVISGQFDPITPPAWAQQAAATLSASVYVNLPASAHGASAVLPCPRAVMIDFLRAPTTAPDTDCVDEMRLQFRGASLPLENQATLTRALAHNE